jgi:predicted transposase/invertase (TIGR01784 family)
MHQEIIEKMLQDKLEEAKQNGIAEGRELALFEVAKAMSANGCDVDLISRVTSLSIADIKTILD